MIQPSSSEDSAGRDVQLVLQQPFKVREKFATILFYRRMNTHCYELNNIALCKTLKPGSVTFEDTPCSL